MATLTGTQITLDGRSFRIVSEVPTDDGVRLELREVALLGLATTSELLTELAVRMEVTQNSTKGRELGRLCRQALDNLDGGVLAYRTVNGDW